MANQHEWLNNIRTAEKSSYIENTSRKIHYKFTDGREMVEEYNTDTRVLLRRIWKCTKNQLGEHEQWEVELGDPIPSEMTATRTSEIKESNTEPVVLRRMTKINLEWRIRNLPYPLETYSVAADPENKCITVRTTNKKYFKKLSIPELDRTGLKPEQKFIQVNHQYNTLIITYRKPQEVLELEAAVLKVLEDVKTTGPAAGDMGCKPS